MDSSLETIDCTEHGCTEHGGESVLDGVYCHETACVDHPVSIGRGTVIGPYSHVMAGASIGEGCQIGRNVVIASTAVIGDGVTIGHNVVVEDGVCLENSVFCGPNVVFAIWSKTRNVRLGGEMAQFFGLESGSESSSSADAKSKPILVREGATLGANSTILGGLTVHIYANVGAGAVVTHDTPRYAVMVGVPARRTAWLCRCTEHHLSFSGCLTTVCPFCDRHYRESNPGPAEFSPAEEKQQQLERCLGFLRRLK
jgi:UDP-2-acetamido-3-amino-2,3-dideoxy-glucuronate N-acetyltransferase